MEAFFELFKANIKNDRVSNAILESLDVLINGGLFQPEEKLLEMEDDIPILHELVKKEMFKSKDTKKLIAGIKVYVMFPYFCYKLTTQMHGIIKCHSYVEFPSEQEDFAVCGDLPCASISIGSCALHAGAVS